MADITTPATHTLHRPVLPQPSLLLVSIGTSILAIPGSIGRAFAMAYVDPYASRRIGTTRSEENSDGRDPGW